LARQHCPAARVLYGVGHIHHIRTARQAAVEGRPELLTRSHQLRVLECAAAWFADGVIIHSDEEAAVLQRAVPGANVHVIPWTTEISAPMPLLSECHGISFPGDYSDSSDIDAARFLANEIMPLVWLRDRTIKCQIIGSDIPDCLRELARPGLVLVSQKADVEDYPGRTRLTVVPSRYGAGPKRAVLDSFASGTPCVMSNIAAEGLRLPPVLQDLVGGTREELAERICRLHADDKLHSSAARAGLTLIQTVFTESNLREGLRAAVGAGAGVHPDALPPYTDPAIDSR
jgi:hypothetical protein